MGRINTWAVNVNTLSCTTTTKKSRDPGTTTSALVRVLLTSLPISKTPTTPCTLKTPSLPPTRESLRTTTNPCTPNGKMPKLPVLRDQRRLLVTSRPNTMPSSTITNHQAKSTSTSKNPTRSKSVHSRNLPSKLMKTLRTTRECQILSVPSKENSSNTRSNPRKPKLLPTTTFSSTERPSMKRVLLKNVLMPLKVPWPG